MTQELITYLLVGLIAFFAVLSFVIGLEKMIKIILGNYVLGSICLSISISIDLTINSLKASGFVDFLKDAKSIIILIIYALLLFLIYHKSKISVEIPSDQILQKSLFLVFVPLTILSICLTLTVIILGTNLMSYDSLLSVSEGFSKSIYIQKFILYIPYRILIHGLTTIFITSEFKTKIKSDFSDL